MTLLAASENPITVQLLPLLTTIVVFGAAFWILKSRVWPRITHGLDERDRKIRDEIRSAQEAREKAKVALAEYEESLASARREAGEMITKAKATAKAAGEELRLHNEAELADMKVRASREIEAAKKSAINEIHAEASILATAIAAKVLERAVSADDQNRLLEESLEELSQVP